MEEIIITQGRSEVNQELSPQQRKIKKDTNKFWNWFEEFQGNCWRIKKGQLEGKETTVQEDEFIQNMWVYYCKNVID